MTVEEKDKLSLVGQVIAVEARIRDLGIVATLKKLYPKLVERDGSFRDEKEAVKPIFLGSSVALGIVAGKIQGNYGPEPTVRLTTLHDLKTDMLTICGEAKPSNCWVKREVTELLYKRAGFSPPKLK